MTHVYMMNLHQHKSTSPVLSRFLAFEKLNHFVKKNLIKTKFFSMQTSFKTNIGNFCLHLLQNNFF